MFARPGIFFVCRALTGDRNAVFDLDSVLVVLWVGITLVANEDVTIEK